eukprot:3829577-Rhodomonas_salina.4
MRLDPLGTVLSSKSADFCRIRVLTALTTRLQTPVAWHRDMSQLWRDICMGRSEAQPGSGPQQGELP